MRKTWIFIFLASAVCAFAKPAGIVPVQGAPYLLEIIKATVFNPQWSDKKPVGIELKWPLPADEMKKYSALLILIENGRALNWRENELASAEEYLKSGGTILFIDNAAGSRPEDSVCKRLKQSGKVHWLSKSYLASKTPYQQKEGRLNADWNDLKMNLMPLHQILLECNTDLIQDKREKWDPVPLGPSGAASFRKVQKPLKPLKSARVFRDLEGETVTISEKTLILLPVASAPGIHGYRVEAARRLQELLKKSAGLQLDFAYEHQVKIQQNANALQAVWRNKSFDTLISIGDTDFAKAQKHKMSQLGDDGIGMIIADSAICLFGREPRDAVHAFATESLGFRWLWPGELGEICPRFPEKIELKSSFCSDDAPLKRRDLRNMLGNKAFVTYYATYGYEKLGETVARYQKSIEESKPWFERQKLGRSYVHFGGANFYGWWKKYSNHPEYFALQFNGIRNQRGNSERICFSNPKVVDVMLDETMPLLDKRKEVKYLTIAPNDGSDNEFCLCVNCRKLDPPGSELEVYRIFIGRNRPHYQYPALSDRMLHFYVNAAKELDKRKPGMKMMALVYSFYRKSPYYLHDIPSNLKFLFVGMQYFNQKELARDRADWDAWSSLTDEMILRPNTLLEGHGMPANYVRELAYDIKHCYQTGMIGADFDSVVHHWATQGLNTYVLAQLLWDPAADPEEIVKDYCQKGFGAAAEHMRKYFHLLEQLTDKVAASNSDSVETLEDLTRTRYNFLDEIPQFYTKAELDKLAAVLELAHQATKADTSERLRVEFMQAGLVYAYSTSEFLQRYNAGERKTLYTFLESRHHELMKIQEKFPFAINFPIIAAKEWSMWRACGWEPWKNK